MSAVPALDVHDADADLVVAVADDYSPTAIEEHDQSLTIYFASAPQRASASEAIARTFPHARLFLRDVDDDNWAGRSQADLAPVRVGGLTIAPPWARPPGDPRAIVVIEPSMGFGTGHHASTRLCLSAMQTLEIHGRSVMDIGTGSGILALAAARLGARTVVAIDVDEDAIRSAQNNLRLNPDIENVEFTCGDLATLTDGDVTAHRADLVLANLTGAALTRHAGTLLRLLHPVGELVLGGLLAHERDDVVGAYSRNPDADLIWEREEDGWLGLVMRPSGSDRSERQSSGPVSRLVLK